MAGMTDPVTAKTRKEIVKYLMFVAKLVQSGSQILDFDLSSRTVLTNGACRYSLMVEFGAKTTGGRSDNLKPSNE